MRDTKAELYFRMNLRYLCNLNQSIADTSRKLGMNRQQLNKYLNGTSTPSVRSLHKICDFFSVEENEIFIEPDEFASLFKLRDKESFIPPSILTALGDIVTSSYENKSRLSQYCGKYFKYRRSPDGTKRICKSLLIIFQHEKMTYSKCVEYASPRRATNKTTYSQVSDSLVHMLGERLYFIHVNSLGRPNENLSMTLCYPSYQSTGIKLKGEKLYVSQLDERKISYSPVVLEKIGTGSIRPSELRQCGVVSNVSEEVASHFAPSPDR